MKKIRRWGNAHIVRRFILVGSPLTYVCLNDNYHSIVEDSDNRVRCQSEILLSCFISSQVLINRQPYIAYVIIFQMLFMIFAALMIFFVMVSPRLTEVHSDRPMPVDFC